MKRKKTKQSKSKEKTKFAIDFFKGYRAGLKSKKAGNRSFGYWSGINAKMQLEIFIIVE